MRQTILAVVLEVQPEATALLRKAIADAAQAQDRLDAIPTLHFLSMTIFEDTHFDPVLVIEANIDGHARHFWPELTHAIGPELMEIVRFAEPPPEGTGRPPAPIVPAQLPAFLEAYAQAPAAAHRGNPGLSKRRVMVERALYFAAQRELDEGALPLGGLTNPQAIHAELRGRLKPPPAQPRRPAALVAEDWARALGFAALVLAILILPFVLVGAVLGTAAAIILALVALTLLILRLRTLERTDPTHDRPRLDEARLKAITARENRSVQNHLASMVLVKPGLLRALLVRLVLPALKHYVALFETKGYLASMRTIHFAHWSLVGNGQRLLFLSNYDGSWESYLDDFIEKAHVGLSLAWTNCIGFPRTRLLAFGGATHGREFKAWARHSQRESLFWYSAYPDLTVNRIERHHAFVEGLRRPHMSEREARDWCALL